MSISGQTESGKISTIIVISLRFTRYQPSKEEKCLISTSIDPELKERKSKKVIEL